jgi:hypothetical protein
LLLQRARAVASASREENYALLFSFHHRRPPDREQPIAQSLRNDYGQRQLVLVDTLTALLYDELTPEFPRASVAVT